MANEYLQRASFKHLHFRRAALHASAFEATGSAHRDDEEGKLRTLPEARFGRCPCRRVLYNASRETGRSGGSTCRRPTRKAAVLVGRAELRSSRPPLQGRLVVTRRRLILEAKRARPCRRRGRPPRPPPKLSFRMRGLQVQARCKSTSCNRMLPDLRANTSVAHKMPPLARPRSGNAMAADPRRRS